VGDVGAPPDPDSILIDLQLGPYSVAAATTFGPRLMSLRYRHGPELFAQLPDNVVITHPDSGTYRFRGGHRLWAAPEVPAITYALDDHPCVVTTETDRLVITAPVDPAGLIKRVTVTLQGERLVVDHHLTNAGLRSVNVALWGITQFRLGGVALIPIGTGVVHHPSQADSSLVIWPYTDLTDRRLSWRRQAAIVEGAPGPPLKVGSGPDPGRIGYLFDRHLFIKEIRPAGAGCYVDRGAVAQVYVENTFCELESVGPAGPLDPGSSASHGEVWEVTECADLATAYDRVVRRPGR
jgi:hypothetical protein